jgi:hypothetical protein
MADRANMKPFFQGLVCGLLVMYGYLNSAELLAPYRGWFGGNKNGGKQSPVHKEIDKARHGFLFQRDTGMRADEMIVRS